MNFKSLKRRHTSILPAAAALLMLGANFPANAALERVGPRNPAPSVGTYPAWYQDKTGLALEFCAPVNQAEVDGGWCNALTGDVFPPEVFPTNFFEEHFYNAAEASVSPPNVDKALLVIGLEAAGNTPESLSIFARIRLRLEPVPATGTYRFIHPYGEDVLEGVAGGRIFATEDFGVNCGDFSCVLNGRYGPFLLPATTPGGAELAAVPGPVPGKLYIADPGRLGPVTGSTLADFVDSTGALRNHNIFRIEGPAGSNLGGPGIDFIETTNFTLMGRIFTGSIPGRVTVDRANYTSSATVNQLDVVANGNETTLGRLPTQPRPAPVLPQLSFYPAACGATAAGALTAPAGLTDIQMVASGHNFWGQISPATIPASVCVKDAAARDASGAVVPAFFQMKVTDHVVVSQAFYDPAARTLSVSATSSDTSVPPTLTLDGYGVDLAGGQIVVPSVIAPPSKARVVSSAGGSTELDVIFGLATGAPSPDALAATNDSFTIPEDSSAMLPVLANDTGAAGGVITILTQPRFGTATVNADGTVTYTANPDAAGLDAFTYQITVGTAVSNSADVSITLAAANDPTTAVDDGPFTVKAGVATALPNVLDNDLDADGRLDIVDAVDLTVPAGATVSGGASGVITFSAAEPGTYTFTYRALDGAGLRSTNAATVTVKVSGDDTVVAASAEFRTDKNRWVVSGSDSEPNQLIHLTYEDGPLAGFEFGTAKGDALGNWTMDQRGVSGNFNPTTLKPVPTRIRATSALGGSGTIGLSIRK
jgi:hypothetical protein